LSKNIRFWDRKISHILDILIISIIYFIAIFLVPLLPSNLILWIIYALVGSFFIVYIFFLSSYFHEDELKSRGFGRLRNLFIRLDNLKKSSKEVLLIITPILVLGIFIASFITGFFWSIKGNGISEYLFGYENLWIDFIFQFLFYIIWGFIQQVLFLSFINVRLRNLISYDTRKGRIYLSIINGAIFSAYHLLNFPLCLFTFVGGTLWAYSFTKNPNMLTVSISHGLGGTLSSIFVFNGVLTMYTGWPPGFI